MSENFDFINDLPSEIKQMILAYLDVEDLLNLCQTCKSLNEIIGQSRNYMKNIWIKFYTFNLRDLESLALSTRNYEKLKVNRAKLAEHFTYLKDLQQLWKKVLIYNSEVKHFRLLAEFIESFAESIEELEVSDIIIVNNDFEICALKFPKLQRILFRNVPTTVIELFLGANKSLENASFDISQTVEGKLELSEILERFLINNEHLKHLQLGPHYIKSLFDQENLNTDFKFKLSKLFLRFPICGDPSTDIETNLTSFLAHQHHIEWILFFELQSDAILTTTWNKIPALSHVTFIGLEGLFDEMDMLIEPNMSIKTVEMLSRRILLSQLRKIFTAAPCLSVLHVHTLTCYIMEFTARNHQLIKELRYENINEEVPEAYENLKKSQEDINKSIELIKASFWGNPKNPFSIDPNFWHS